MSRKLARDDDEENAAADDELASAAERRAAAAAATPPALKYAWLRALWWSVLGASADTLRPNTAASSSVGVEEVEVVGGGRNGAVPVGVRALLLRPERLREGFKLVLVLVGTGDGALELDERPASLM